MLIPLVADPRSRRLKVLETLGVKIPEVNVCNAELVDSVFMRGERALACSSLRPEDDVTKSAGLKIGFVVIFGFIKTKYFKN